MTTQINPYLIENKKQTEIVYELKNEIPSYEEFARNYEIDKRINDSYESEFQEKVLTGPQYGSGSEQSKQRLAKISMGAGVAIITAVCPPSGVAVSGAMIGAGTFVVAATDVNDNHDNFARELGIDLIETGLLGSIGAASCSGSHAGKNCRLSICPKK